MGGAVFTRQASEGTNVQNRAAPGPQTQREAQFPQRPSLSPGDFGIPTASGSPPAPLRGRVPRESVPRRDNRKQCWHFCSLLTSARHPLLTAPKIKPRLTLKKKVLLAYKRPAQDSYGSLPPPAEIKGRHCLGLLRPCVIFNEMPRSYWFTYWSTLILENRLASSL